MPNELNIIRHRGQPNKATFQGYTVERRESLPVQLETGAIVMIPCAPYDDHFVFEKPPQLEGILIGPVHYCTCGSAAVAAHFGTSEAMFVCLLHMNDGFHQTSVVNLKDYDKHAQESAEGKVLIARKRGQKWE